MFSLKNEMLEVILLDPQADQTRFGTRYCTGGYIFQIVDATQGNLLSGPTYPDSFNTFDGQGIPDAFNLSPLRPPAASDPTALIIGVGLCDLTANQVLEFCTWEIQQIGTEITMRTEQKFQQYTLTLERTVTLQQRSVRSAVRLTNTGGWPIPLRWFPHPFYPQLADSDELCRLNIPVDMPDNPAYKQAENGFICRQDWPWQDGHYQALDHAAQTNLVILQRHPLLGLVAASCSYVPSFFPIWGNANTFSWEPFLERAVAGGQTLRWWIDYDF